MKLGAAVAILLMCACFVFAGTPPDSTIVESENDTLAVWIGVGTSAADTVAGYAGVERHFHAYTLEHFSTHTIRGKVHVWPATRLELLGRHDFSEMFTVMVVALPEPILPNINAIVASSHEGNTSHVPSAQPGDIFFVSPARWYRSIEALSDMSRAYHALLRVEEKYKTKKLNLPLKGDTMK